MFSTSLADPDARTPWGLRGVDPNSTYPRIHELLLTTTSRRSRLTQVGVRVLMVWMRSVIMLLIVLTVTIALLVCNATRRPWVAIWHTSATGFCCTTATSFSAADLPAHTTHIDQPGRMEQLGSFYANSRTKYGALLRRLYIVERGVARNHIPVQMQKSEPLCNYAHPCCLCVDVCLTRCRARGTWPQHSRLRGAGDHWHLEPAHSGRVSSLQSC